MEHKNYIELSGFSPFHAYFAYLDSPEYMADSIFVKNNIRHIHFAGEYVKDDEAFRIVMCWFRKKYRDAFMSSMEELYTKALLLEGRAYATACEEIDEKWALELEDEL